MDLLLQLHLKITLLLKLIFSNFVNTKVREETACFIPEISNVILKFFEKTK